MATVATLPAEAISRPPARALGTRLRLDPRVWLVGFASVAIWVSTASSLVSTAVIAVMCLTALFVGHKSTRRLAYRVAPLGWMLIAGLLTVVLYALFGQSESSVSSSLLGVTINIGAIQIGLLMALRLISLLTLSLLVLSSVPALDLAAGSTRFLMPLRELGFAVANVFYLTFFISRMVPGLVHESRMIYLAQMSRGVGAREGILGRLRSYPARILPIFASALRRSDSMSLLLISRGFDSSRLPRKVTDLRFAKADYIAVAAIGVGWAVWMYLQLGRG